MGNEQSLESKRRDANVQAALERTLEKQRLIYEQRCRQMLQAQAESLRQIDTDSTSGRTGNVGTSRGGQSNLYPNLQATTSTAEPSLSTVISASSYDRNSFFRERNDLSTNNNTSIVPSTNNKTRVMPSAPPIPSNPPMKVNSRQSNSDSGLGTELNCRKCGNKFGLTIFQCTNGHSSCRDCRKKGGVCGVLNCGQMITDMRNRTLEAYMADLMLAVKEQAVNVNNPVVNQLFSQSKIHCPNHRDGCSLHFTSDEMDNHLKECMFNEMACPLLAIFGRCSWRGKFNHLERHFADYHPEHCGAQVDTEMSIVNIRDDNRTFYLVLIGSFNFYIHLKIDSNAKMIYLAAQLVGTTMSASKWRYEFHIYNKAQPKRKFQYFDVCKSNSISIENIFKDRQCAVIPIEYVSTFMNHNCLNYKFFLKKEIKKK